MTTETKASPPKSVLIVGFGDIGERVARRLHGSCTVRALVRRTERIQVAEACGAVPLMGDLAEPNGLLKAMQTAGTPDIVIHLAPPLAQGETDQGTSNLLHALSATGLPQRLVYVSTTGVYGDTGGAWVDESTPLNPQSDRARRRVAAERQLHEWAIQHGVTLTILRAPGIYADNRLPITRLLAGSPAITADEDSFSNHIHADDLASACIAAMSMARTDVFNIVDDSTLKMGDYFDLVADRFRLPRAPRIARAEAERLVGPAMWSFMRESRRIHNQKMKDTQSGLELSLRWPRVADFLAAMTEKEVADALASATRGETRPR